MKNRIKKIGLLTSGGDAPGMNAAIRAITLNSLANNLEIVGIRRGYSGLIEEDYCELNPAMVDGIMDKGGTVLLSARCAEMRLKEGQEKAAANCRKQGLDGLIVIGGDGSITGASRLADLGINAIGIPATIDLDLPCSKYTIGFDTAVNTVIDAIGRIRDTSSSHERCSIVEVMGRHAGWIALWAAISTGAEQVIMPEFSQDITVEEITDKLIHCRNNWKKDHLIVMGEGMVPKIGNAYELAKKIEAQTKIETRGTILGHIQRGGSPSAIDRIHSTKMGVKAVELLLEGATNRIVIYDGGKYTDIDIQEGLAQGSEPNEKLYQIFQSLTI